MHSNPPEVVHGKMCPTELFLVVEYNCNWWFQSNPVCGGVPVKHTEAVPLQRMFLLAETPVSLAKHSVLGI